MLNVKQEVKSELESQHAADFGRVGLAGFDGLASAGEEGDEADACGGGEKLLAVAAGEDSSGEFSFQRRQEFGEYQAAGVSGAGAGLALAGDSSRGDCQAQLLLLAFDALGTDAEPPDQSLAEDATDSAAE